MALRPPRHSFHFFSSGETKRSFAVRFLGRKVRDSVVSTVVSLTYIFLVFCSYIDIVRFVIVTSLRMSVTINWFLSYLCYPVCLSNLIIITSLPKAIWEQGRVAAAVPGAGWHKGLRIRNVCIVFVKDRCANVRYFSVRKQEKSTCLAMHGNWQCIRTTDRFGKAPRKRTKEGEAIRWTVTRSC